ncbi:MAG: hypothetical protein M1587_10500 [Thaumarchaeota archaeon]|nr:hypothetical protein [Nitrososphaerota archaeon]
MSQLRSNTLFTFTILSEETQSGDSHTVVGTGYSYDGSRGLFLPGIASVGDESKLEYRVSSDIKEKGSWLTGRTHLQDFNQWVAM